MSLTPVHPKPSMPGPLHGFTLIELLVVVSIIALLLSVLLPALSRTRGVTKQVMCKNNLRQVALGAFFYAQQNSDYLPAVHGLWQTVSRQVGLPLPDLTNPANWQNFKTKGTISILFCPVDPDPYPQPHFNNTLQLTSYMANGTDTDFAMGTGQPLPIGLFSGKQSILKVRSPASCMLVGENCNFDRVIDCDHPAALKAAQEAGNLITLTTRREMHHRATSGFYHFKKMNVMYVDGHCEDVQGMPADVLPANEQPTGLFLSPRSFTYFADLSLPNASENPAFWGPPYEN